MKMNPNEDKTEAEEPLVRPILPNLPEGELTAEDWYAYKARWRHYDSERLRRGLITKEQFDRGNSLAQMWGDLDELMKKARIDFKPGTLPDFLQRMAGERVRSARGAGETGDGESL
jgi:hypothetical protein